MLLPRHMLVDQGDDVEPLGRRGESGDVAVLEGTDAQSSGGSLQEPVEQCVGSAQVAYGYGAWFSINPAGLDDTPIGSAADDMPLQASHMFCVYNRTISKVKRKPMCSLSAIISLKR